MRSLNDLADSEAGQEERRIWALGALARTSAQIAAERTQQDLTRLRKGLQRQWELSGLAATTLAAAAATAEDHAVVQGREEAGAPQRSQGNPESHGNPPEASEEEPRLGAATARNPGSVGALGERRS